MGLVSGVPLQCFVFCSPIPLAAAKNLVAPAQPADRYLRFHWCDSRRAPGHDGVRHALWTGGTVCRISRNVGIHSQLRSLEAANAAVSNELAARLQRRRQPCRGVPGRTEEARSVLGRRRVCAWYGEKPLPLCNEFKGPELARPGIRKRPISRHRPRSQRIVLACGHIGFRWVRPR